MEEGKRGDGQNQTEEGGDWLKERKGANNAVFEEPNEKRRGDQIKETEKRQTKQNEVCAREWEISRHINIRPMLKNLQRDDTQSIIPYSSGLMWLTGLVTGPCGAFRERQSWTTVWIQILALPTHYLSEHNQAYFLGLCFFTHTVWLTTVPTLISCKDEKTYTCKCFKPCLAHTGEPVITSAKAQPRSYCL